uniref:BPTI/Kunitz inhibitor domain-containing protein n=1 Tax=Zosterops lateralis melanops TaxID=1220523 RepID=A0A8D2PPD4_ZOSLA
NMQPSSRICLLRHVLCAHPLLEIFAFQLIRRRLCNFKSLICIVIFLYFSNYILKWYYDKEQKMCGQFWYGGCGGNKNRFETQEECEFLCIESS